MSFNFLIPCCVTKIDKGIQFSNDFLYIFLHSVGTTKFWYFCASTNIKSNQNRIIRIQVVCSKAEFPLKYSLN